VCEEHVRFTDVYNIHTYPIRRSNLVIASVAVMHGELLELTGNMVCGPGI
jgi:hypothetical protein